MKSIFLTSLLSALVFIGAQEALAFEFVEPTCSVEKSEALTFKIAENEFESNVNFSFKFDQNLVPLFRIQFFQHRPQKVFLQWKNIQGGEADALFSPDIQPTIASLEGASIELFAVQTSDASIVFETKDLDVRKAQAMVALFLSQTNANMIVESESGGLWSANLSLTGTNNSYKNLAITCQPDRSSTYLETSGALKSGDRIFVRTAVSTGYGLLDYASQLPTSADVEQAQAITFQNFNTAAPLLRQKNILLMQFEALRTTDFVSSITSFDEFTKENLEIFNRIQEISGGVERTDGLIPRLNQQMINLQQTITTAQSGIVSESEKIAALTVELETISQALSPFLPQINEFTEREQQLREKSNAILSLIENLNKMLEEKKTIVGQNTSPSRTSETSPPWSLEVIEQKNSEIASQQSEYHRISELVGDLNLIYQDSKSLVDFAHQQDSAMTQYLGLVSEKRQTETDLQNKTTEIRQMNELPYLADLDDISFVILNTRLEETIPTAERNFDNEFLFHQQKFEKLSEQFVSFKQELLDSTNLTFLNLICDPNIILDPQLKTSPCLNPDQILNTSLRTKIIASLPPVLIDSLLGDVANPWTASQSKAEVLSERISQELAISDAELEQLLQNWTLIRLVVWRWSSQQRSPEELSTCEGLDLTTADDNFIFNSVFYDHVFHCEKRRLVDLETQIMDLQTRVQRITAEIEGSNSNFKAFENEYNALSQSFAQKISILQEDATNEQFFQNMYGQCLIPLLNPLQCQSSVELIFDTKFQFEASVATLQSQILQMLELQRSENGTIEQELNDLQLAMTEFTASNNLDPLLGNRSTALVKLSESEGTIQILNALIVETNANSVDLQIKKQELVNEESVLIARASLLSLKMLEQKSLLSDECTGLVDLLARMRTLDIQIQTALGLPIEPTPLPTTTTTLNETTLNEICK